MQGVRRKVGQFVAKHFAQQFVCVARKEPVIESHERSLRVRLAQSAPHARTQFDTHTARQAGDPPRRAPHADVQLQRSVERRWPARLGDVGARRRHAAQPTAPAPPASL